MKTQGLFEKREKENCGTVVTTIWTAYGSGCVSVHLDSNLYHFLDEKSKDGGDMSR